MKDTLQMHIESTVESTVGDRSDEAPGSKDASKKKKILFDDTEDNRLNALNVPTQGKKRG